MAFCLGILVAAIPYNTAYAQAPSGGVPSAKKFNEPLPPSFFNGCTFSLTGSIVSSLLLCGLSALLFVISSLIGWLIQLAIWFVELALTFNGALIQLPAVQVGWRIVRDIANLGFVLGIVVIAFATILRSQTYGMKQILWKFIVMAILINFSLSIAGILLDLSGVITQFFLDKISQQGASGFGAALISSLAVPKLQEPNQGIWETIKGAIFTDFKNTLKYVITLAFYVLFMGLTLIIIIALAIMLFIRFLYLGILLIVMPIVWLFWVFPNLSYIFKQWWDNFIKWAMFAPASMFFIYLSIYTMLGQAKFIQELGDKASQQQGSAAETLKGLLAFSDNPAVVFGNMALTIGLLFASLIVANKMGITGAAVAQKFATGFTKGFSKGISGLGWKGTKALGQIKPAQWLKQKATATGLNLQQIPVLGTTIRGIGKAAKTVAPPFRDMYQAVYNGMAQETGLFKKMGEKKGEKRKEKKEEKEKNLTRNYNRKIALQGEINILETIKQRRMLSSDEALRLDTLNTTLDDITQKIETAEKELLATALTEKQEKEGLNPNELITLNNILAQGIKPLT